MKKLMSILMVICLCAGLCACKKSSKPKTPEETYERALGSVNTASGVKVTFTSNVTLLENDGSMQAGFDGVLCVSRTEAGEIASVDGTLTLNQSGTELEIPVQYYYEGGRLYTAMNNSKYYAEMSFDTAISRMGPGCAIFFTAAEGDFTELNFTENEDGTGNISFILPAEKIDCVSGLEGLWNGLVDTAGEDASITFQDVRGYVTCDESYAPAEASLTLTASLNRGGSNIAVTDEISLSVELSEELTISAPDTGSYTELTD